MGSKGRQHADDASLRRVARGRGDAEERAHVEQCRACAKELELLRALGAAVAGLRPPGPCPDALDLVRFHDGHLAPDAAQRIDAHLTACRTCAGEDEALARAEAGEFRLPIAASAFAGRAQALAEALRGLFTFEMPPSLALTMRGAAATDPAYDDAMRQYREGAYDEARRGLEQVLSREDRPEAAFYLGACHLKASRWEDAARALELAVQRTPRVGEYHWFLAQALLQLGEGERAAAELEKAAKVPGSRKAQAKDLARKVRATLS
jgi:tetratricopeptide (TPR) repeat protein